MGNNDDFLKRRDEVLGHLKAQLDNLFANGYDLALVGFEINAAHKDKGDFNIELAFNWNERVRSKGPWIDVTESSGDRGGWTAFTGKLHGFDDTPIEIHGSFRDVV
jgi:hypothetical protein